MILERARKYGRRVRIDMEESALVDVTLDIYRRLRFGEGFDNVGVVIQAYLFRSEQDVKQLIEEGAWVRLVKGAYKEPPDIAFAAEGRHRRQHGAPDGDDAERPGAQKRRLPGRRQPRRGDHRRHQRVCRSATRSASRNTSSSCSTASAAICRRQLVAQGYRVRIYVPYGTAWYPYFMRRLAERPANLWFFVSNFFKG